MSDNNISTILGLDISTSVIGVCLLAKNDGGEVVVKVLEPIKLNTAKTKAMSLFEKADYAVEELVTLVPPSSITVGRIFVEANAKMFAQGRTSADVLMTLAKFNGIFSYVAQKALGKPKVIDVNVSSARKAIGFKKITGSSLTIKEQVFQHVTTMHPEFPWKKHIAKTGMFQGQEVFDSEMKDCCDAYVIAKGGSLLFSK